MWVKLVMGRVVSEIIDMIYSQDSTYCYAILIETPFQTLTLHKTCRRRVNVWCKTSGYVKVSSLLPPCSQLHLGTVHSGPSTLLFLLLPPISFSGRTDRKPDHTAAKRRFAISFAEARISSSVWVQCLIPYVCNLTHAPRYTFINRSTSSAMAVSWSNLN